jgi:hypothetical protein
MRRPYGKDAVVEFHYYATDEEEIRVTHFTTLNSQTFRTSSIVRTDRYTAFRNRFGPLLQAVKT